MQLNINNVEQLLKVSELWHSAEAYYGSGNDTIQGYDTEAGDPISSKDLVELIKYDLHNNEGKDSYSWEWNQADGKVVAKGTSGYEKGLSCAVYYTDEDSEVYADLDEELYNHNQAYYKSKKM